VFWVTLQEPPTNWEHLEQEVNFWELVQASFCLHNLLLIQDLLGQKQRLLRRTS
jgi:hypothetical protein